MKKTANFTVSHLSVITSAAKVQRIGQTTKEKAFFPLMIS